MKLTMKQWVGKIGRYRRKAIPVFVRRLAIEEASDAKRFLESITPQRTGAMKRHWRLEVAGNSQTQPATVSNRVRGRGRDSYAQFVWVARRRGPLPGGMERPLRGRLKRRLQTYARTAEKAAVRKL